MSKFLYKIQFIDKISRKNVFFCQFLEKSQFYVKIDQFLNLKKLKKLN